MELINNGLIKKYFGCYCGGVHRESSPDPKHNSFWCDKFAAHNILSAMGQPIKKGEKYLVTLDDGQWVEITRTTDYLRSEKRWHPTELRIPDQFQP